MDKATLKELGICVIIPTYNCRDYLDECLRSILMQLPPDCELIVADDGYHILYFTQDLANDWDTLRDNKLALWAEMLAQKRQQAADDAIAQWIGEADVQVSPTLLSF